MKQFSWNKIKEHREAAGLTQEQLGSAIGVLKQQISAWENSGDEKSLTTAHLASIADAVRKSTEDFFIEVSRPGSAGASVGGK
jgi:DNA-binding XRE family transcriptional regulator